MLQETTKDTEHSVVVRVKVWVFYDDACFYSMDRFLLFLGAGLELDSVWLNWRSNSDAVEPKTLWHQGRHSHYFIALFFTKNHVML